MAIQPKIKRKKTFTGCWTCRTRKVKCDTTKPFCNRCKKAGLTCEGYDIKLRWYRPLAFNRDGTQANEPSIDEPPGAKSYHQRRNIGFVKYPQDMVYETYEEVDKHLSILHSAANLTGDQTKQLGPFAVFIGTSNSNSSKKNNSSNKGKSAQRNLQSVADASGNNAIYQTPTREDSVDENSASKRRKLGNEQPPMSNYVLQNGATVNQSYFLNDSQPQDYVAMHQLFNESFPSYGSQNLTLFDQGQLAPQQNQQSQHMNNGAYHYQPPASYQKYSEHLPQPHSGNTTNAADNNNSSINVSITERDNAAIEGNIHPNLIQQQQQQHEEIRQQQQHQQEQNQQQQNSAQQLSRAPERYNQFATTQYTSEAHPEDSSTYDSRQTFGSSVSNGIHSDTRNILMESYDIDNRNNRILVANNAQSYNFFENQPARSNGALSDNQNQGNDVNDSDQSSLHSSFRTAQGASIGKAGTTRNTSETGVSGNDNSMNNFKNYFNLFRRNPDDQKKDSQFINFMEMADSGIEYPPNVGLSISKTIIISLPVTRFLLTHFQQNIAEQMSVYPLSRNPWRTIYVPRALKALGDLFSFGECSCENHCTLHALVAVSAYHVAKTFGRGSPGFIYWRQMGKNAQNIAASYLNRCIDQGLDGVKYKDMFVSFLSLAMIDVSSGTMRSCRKILRHCARYVEHRVKHGRSLSAKAKTLHRIFSISFEILESTQIFTISDDMNEEDILQQDEFTLDQEPNSANGKKIVNEGHQANGKSQAKKNKSGKSSADLVSGIDEDGHLDDESKFYPRTSSAVASLKRVTYYNSNILMDSEGSTTVPLIDHDEDKGVRFMSVVEQESTDAASHRNGSSDETDGAGQAKKGPGEPPKSSALEDSGNATPVPKLSESNSGASNGDNTKATAGAQGHATYREKINEKGRVSIEYIMNSNHGSPKAPPQSPQFLNVANEIFQKSPKYNPRFGRRSAQRPPAGKEERSYFGLDTMTGLPHSVLLLLSQVVELYKKKCEIISLVSKEYDLDFVLSIDTIPLNNDIKLKIVNFRLDMKKLEDELASWKLEWGIWEKGGDDVMRFPSPMYYAAFHYLMSFKRGIDIYFYRVLQHVPYNDIEPYIESCADHLLAVKSIIDKQQVTIIPIFWPTFVAAAEARSPELESKFVSYFEMVSQICISDYYRAFKALRKIWDERRARNDDSYSWPQLQRDYDVDLMLT